MNQGMHGFDWRYVGALAGLLSVYSGVLLWAVRVLLKRQSDDTANKLLELMRTDKSQDQDIEEVRRELAEHKVEVAKNYIRREDALVFFARFEQKIDAVWNFLHKRVTSNGSR